MVSESNGARIRYATPADAVAVRRFVFDILAEYGIPADPDGSDADVMEFGEPRDPRVVHLIAEADGVPIGSAILTPYPQGRVKLSKLFVRSDRRRGGIGRNLLRRAVAEARDRGYREIFLTTRGVYREAVSLYEAEGWARGPDQPPPGPDRLYRLPLSPGADHAGGDGPGQPIRIGTEEA